MLQLIEMIISIKKGTCRPYLKDSSISKRWKCIWTPNLSLWQHYESKSHSKIHKDLPDIVLIFKGGSSSLTRLHPPWLPWVPSLIILASIFYIRQCPVQSSECYCRTPLQSSSVQGWPAWTGRYEITPDLLPHKYVATTLQGTTPIGEPTRSL